jgi:nucleotide-binding universal stress UspA family protein
MARSPFRHILVPHDFSPQATVALRAAARLAKQHGGKLTVLHVVVPLSCPPMSRSA